MIRLLVSGSVQALCQFGVMSKAQREQIAFALSRNRCRLWWMPAGVYAGLCGLRAGMTAERAV